MFYSCELLDLHIKVSVEGFGTLHCFLKQIVTNTASEFGFIVFQIGSRYSPFFISYYADRELEPLCFQLSHHGWTDGLRAHLNIVAYLVFTVLRRPDYGVGCNIGIQVTGKFSINHASEWNIIKPFWSCGFGSVSLLTSMLSALF